MTAQGLSLERARAALGPGCQLSDAELEHLRDQLTILAGILLDSWHVASDRTGPKMREADPLKAG